MLEKRVGSEDHNEMVMMTGAVAFFLYLHSAEKTAGVYGLSFGDMVVLKHLHSLKDEINLTQLRDKVMMLSGASITKIIDKLLQMGYVERRENPASRREKLVKATSDGKKIFTKLMKEIQKLNGKVLEGFQVSDKKRLSQELMRIQENVMKMGIEA